MAKYKIHNPVCPYFLFPISRSPHASTICFLSCLSCEVASVTGPAPAARGRRGVKCRGMQGFSEDQPKVIASQGPGASQTDCRHRLQHCWHTQTRWWDAYFHTRLATVHTHSQTITALQYLHPTLSLLPAPPWLGVQV